MLFLLSRRRIRLGPVSPRMDVVVRLMVSKVVDLRSQSLTCAPTEKLLNGDRYLGR